MRDLKNNISAVQSLAPASQTAAADGAGVDLQGFNSACAVIDAGASGGTSPDFTFEIQESDDNAAFTAVADADLHGTEPQITGANDNAVYRVGYVGNKRYIRISITTVTGSTPTLLCAGSVIRGNPEGSPVA